MVALMQNYAAIYADVYIMVSPLMAISGSVFTMGKTLLSNSRVKKTSTFYRMPKNKCQFFYSVASYLIFFKV